MSISLPSQQISSPLPSPLSLPQEKDYSSIDLCIDISHYLKQLKYLIPSPPPLKISASTLDIFSREPMGGLIETAQSIYVLALIMSVGKDKADFPHTFDAQHLEIFLQKGAKHPITKRAIEKVYYYVNSDNQKFHFSHLYTRSIQAQISDDADSEEDNAFILPPDFISDYLKAQANDRKAQCQLGNRYYRGEGVKKDINQAIHWYRKAAAQEQVDALYNLGCIYEKGEGVDKDTTQAIKFFEKALDQYAKTLYNLGYIYANGYRVDKDMTQAIKFYKEAADLEHGKALYNLGHIYANGDGVDKDRTQAIKYYKKASAQGKVEAQFKLGQIFEQSNEFPKNRVLAIKWYKRAADLDHEEAQSRLRELQKSVSPENSNKKNNAREMSEESSGRKSKKHKF